MNVGVVAEAIDMQSLKYVFEALEQSLAKRHNVIHRSLEFFYSSSRRQEELHDEFVLNSDILVGRIDERVFRSRERLDRQPPMICFLLGAISRGGGELPWVHHYLKSTDVLVGNCSGDIEIAAKFFKNGQVRKLPFSFDESTFHAIDEARRQTLKAELGFQKSDQILLYAGRITLEKNGVIQINDPIFPMDVSMQEGYQETCHAILEILKREPVVQLKRLNSLMARPLMASTEKTLKWMLNAGILLRTRPMNPSIDPELIGDQMSRPVFTIQNVDYRTDAYVIKQMW